MASTQDPWRSDEVVAFTRHDGPGRPPAAPSGWSIGVLAGVLAVTFTGVVATDALCPEHRAWVQALGGFAVFASGAGLVALLRGWAGAVHLTLAAGLAGVGIGGIDAVHSPTRGVLVAFGFGLVCVLAAAMSWRVRRLATWDRQLAVAVSASVDQEPAKVAAPGDARAVTPDASRSTGKVPTVR